jgi:putative tricarboxylic transport membrane protein
MVSIVFLIFSCLVMIESVRLKLNTIHNPGPGFMPFFLGLSLAILSILSLFFPDLRKKGPGFWNDWQRGQSTFYMFAGLIAYLLLFKVLGFYVDTFLLMVYLIKISGEKGYKRLLLVSLLTMAVTYLLFYKLLFIPFPQGLLGI